MEMRLTVLRKRRTDWLITWQQNKVRWLLFYYAVGLIFSCLLMFFEEVLFCWTLSYLIKALIVLVLIPCSTVLVSIAVTSRRKQSNPSGEEPQQAKCAEDGFWKRYQQPLLGLLMFGLWAAGYYAVAYATEAQATHRLPTFRWEREINLTSEFVLIYLTIYPTFLLPFLFIRQKDFFRLFSFAYITVMCICYTVYLLFPVSIERPVFTVNSFSSWVLAIVYSLDRPWNCFPSLHVAMSFLAALTILEVHRIRGMLTLLLTFCIAYSTVLIKQHYVLDVLAALVLTFVIHFVYVRRRILNTLFENILRAEGTLERWINRKIDNRVWESLDGPLRARLTELIRSMIDESLKNSQKERDQPGLFPETKEYGRLLEEDKQ